jgi:hypothetical protein
MTTVSVQCLTVVCRPTGMRGLMIAEMINDAQIVYYGYLPILRTVPQIAPVYRLLRIEVYCEAKRTRNATIVSLTEVVSLLDS